jgi:hypothetical protein
LRKMWACVRVDMCRMYGVCGRVAVLRDGEEVAAVCVCVCEREGIV